MKRLLLATIILSACFVAWAQTPPIGEGTTVGNTIVPAGAYPTHAADYGLGGYHSVSNLTDVPAYAKQEGMAVFELQSDILYILHGTNWTPFTAGTTNHNDLNPLSMNIDPNVLHVTAADTNSWWAMATVTNTGYGVTNFGTDLFPLFGLTMDVTNDIAKGVIAWTATTNLDTAAYSNASVFATSNQGARADTAWGATTNLGSAAYSDSNTFALSAWALLSTNDLVVKRSTVYVAGTNAATGTIAMMCETSGPPYMSMSRAASAFADSIFLNPNTNRGSSDGTHGAAIYFLGGRALFHKGGGITSPLNLSEYWMARTNNTIHFSGDPAISGNVTGQSNLTLTGTASLNSNVTVVGTGTFSNRVQIIGSSDNVQLSVKADATGNSNVFAVLDNSGAAVATVSKTGNLTLSGASSSSTARVTTDLSVGGTGNIATLVNRGVTNMDSFYWPTYYMTNSTGTNTIAFTNGVSVDLVCTGAAPCYITAASMAASSYGQMSLYIDNNGTNAVTWDTNVFNAAYWPELTGTNGTDLVLVKTAGSTMLTVNGPVTPSQMLAAPITTNVVVTGTMTVSNNVTATGTLTASNVVLSTFRWVDSPMVFAWEVAAADAPNLTTMNAPFDGIKALLFDDSDTASFMCQVNHDLCPSNSTGYVEPHAHVLALDDPPADANRTQIRIIYTGAAIGGQLFSPITNTVEVVLSTNTHHLVEFSHLPFTNHYPGISGKYWGTLTRLAAGASNFTGQISMDGDFHYPVDRMGSAGDSAP